MNDPKAQRTQVPFHFYYSITICELLTLQNNQKSIIFNISINLSSNVSHCMVEKSHTNYADCIHSRSHR